MKIAIYGGSFNPPHLGHLEAAKTVCAELAPDKLLIIPDNIPPHKAMDPGSPTAEERLALCRIAFRSIPGAEISDMEIRRHGKSYTAHTVRELRGRYPDDELFLVVGSDMLLSFEEWYEFEYLLSECTLAVVSREEDDLDALRAHSVVSLTLEVRDSNEPAIRLYESLGFRQVGLRKRYYFHPTEDARILKKEWNE